MTVNHCCCGCSLKTGCIIIGTMCMMTGGFVLLSVFQNFNISELQLHWNYLHKTIIGVIGTIHLVMAIMLIIGADMEKPRLLFAWIVYYVIKLLLTVICIIYIMIIIATTHQLINVLTVAASSVFGLGIGVYSTIVVNSYYFELKERMEKMLLKETA